MRIENIRTNNLLHTVKKRLVSAEEINRYLKKTPNANRRIGSLPIDFYSKIPNSNKTIITQKVGDIFEKFSQEAEAIEETCDAYVYSITETSNKMVEKLKKILNRTDIKSSYVDSGSFKNCHKLEVGKFSYALSVFKRYPLFDYRGYFRDSHGKGNEPQNIFTTYKRFSKGRVCRPFLANISGENDDGGFILSKFIEPAHEIKKERGAFISSRNYLKNVDRLGNSVNGIFIEAGGFIENKKYIKDRILRKTWQNFAECLDSNITLLSKSKLANKIQESIINAIDNGLEINNTASLKTYISSLPKEEKKFANKLLLHANKINTLKKQATLNNTYNSIKEFLKEDLCDLFSFETYSQEFSEKKTLPEIYEGYPRLLTQILEIDNVPSLKEMLYLIESHSCCIDIDLKKYYNEDDVKELLTKHYNEIRFLFSFDYLKEFFNI